VLQRSFHFFLVGFAVLVAMNSLGLLPKAANDIANEVSRWSLVTAIAALGMKTSFKDLAAVGWRPIAVMVLETAWIAATTFIAVSFAYEVSPLPAIFGELVSHSIVVIMVCVD